MLIRASVTRCRAEEVTMTDPDAVDLYGETPEQAAAMAASLGLECE
jgi:hypothetical protein